MTQLSMAVVQTHWRGEREATAAAYGDLVRQAAAGGAQIVGLPEFTLSPYFASTIDRANERWAEPLRGGPSDQHFGDWAREHGVYLFGSLFEREEQADGAVDFWDTATVHGPDGALLGFTRKVHIPQGEGYHEDHYFGGAHDFPLHDVLGLKVALPTCYDQWFPELARIYALAGADLIFYPTAIGSEPTNPAIDTQAAWQTVMRGHAIANGVYIAAANRTGREGVAFYGSSFICDPTGNVLADAGRNETTVVDAPIDLDLLREWRRLFPLLQQRRPELYGALVE